MHREISEVSANASTKHESSAEIAAAKNGPAMITAEMIADEMNQLVRDDVRLLSDESLQRGWERAARIYGMTVRRVRAYWNHEVRTVPAHEADTIRGMRLRMAILRQERLNAQLAEVEQMLKELGQ